MADPAPYPAQWEADVLLRDGRPLHLRPITPEDADGLRKFHQSLSDDTVYYRFFAPRPELSDREVERVTNVDDDERVALVAIEDDEIVAVATYDLIRRGEAEVAFTVRDDHQGRGLGSVLLEHLAAAALDNGITTFYAEVLPTNRRMIGTFTEAGYQPTQATEDGVIHLSFDIEPTARTVEVVRAREQRAESRSVQAVLFPSTVAVVGASDTEGKVGYELLRNVVRGGFVGPVIPIHREKTEVQGLVAYPSVTDAPGPVDLVIVAVPESEVPAVLADCAEADVRGVIVVSAGFAEGGAAGRASQDALVALARGTGMRLIGPNALGLVNTDPSVSLNASLASRLPGPGRIGFFCQSGALGSAVLADARRRELGISTFLSAGNRADVSVNDMLHYWVDDGSTNVVLLYMESVGNPRKFARIAAATSRRKPVVALRAGRTTQALPLAGVEAATTLPPQAIESLFAEAGIIGVDTLGELFEVAALASFQPLPRSGSVGVVTNSHALMMMAMDALRSTGLEPAEGSVLLEVTDGAPEVAAGVEAALADPAVDSVLVLHVTPVTRDDSDIRAVLADQAKQATKPILAVLPSVDADSPVIPVASGRDGMPGHGSIPVMEDVQAAVRALKRVTSYALWRAKDPGEHPMFLDVDPRRAELLIDSLVQGTPDLEHTAPVGRAGPVRGSAADGAAVVALSELDVSELLDAYGIGLWPSIPVLSEDEAAESASDLGYPVALKTTSRALAHRPELGGLRLNLESERALRGAYLSLTALMGDSDRESLVVQRMAPPGVGCVIRVINDPVFGPVVSLRIAGPVSDLLGDEIFRVPPMTDAVAANMITELRASALFRGYDGAQTADVQALAELLMRVGQLADSHPEVASLELHPVLVGERGLAVLGASAVLRPAGARLSWQARRLEPIAE